MVTDPAPCAERPGPWQVYLIACSDGSLYAGITTDIARRFRQHSQGRGAKYFRGRRPLQVVFLESGHTRSSAGRREVEIKQLTRLGKLKLIEAFRKRGERHRREDPVQHRPWCHAGRT